MVKFGALDSALWGIIRHYSTLVHIKFGGLDSAQGPSTRLDTI